jgi:hypothetical protein
VDDGDALVRANPAHGGSRDGLAHYLLCLVLERLVLLGYLEEDGEFAGAEVVPEVEEAGKKAAGSSGRGGVLAG